MGLPRKARQAAQEAFIPVMRELVRAYQAFASHDAGLLRTRGLTTAQADVLFTLGNTDGMTFKELGERTLITKGTLTGVVDRLEGKGLVRRTPCPGDRRSFLAVLTPAGDRLFQRVFPEHIAALKICFDGLSRRRMQEARRILQELRELF